MFVIIGILVVMGAVVGGYLMELETDTHHHEALIPAHNIAMVADALPGLGIVAAVLGVVLTMGKINEPPEVLGQSIGAAPQMAVEFGRRAIPTSDRPSFNELEETVRKK